VRHDGALLLARALWRMLDGDAGAGGLTQRFSESRYARLHAGAHVERPNVQSLGMRQWPRCRQKRRFRYVSHIHIIARLATVAVHGEWPTVQDAAAKDRDDARLAMRILPWPVDVRVAHDGGI